MGKSFATVTPTDMEIGPCQVTFNAIDLGGTKGNVKIKFKYEQSWIGADQFGPKTKLDGAISGMECTVETQFLEVRNKAAFANVFPAMTKAGTTPHFYVDMKDQTAVRQLALAQPLTLHPLVEDVTSFDQDMYFYKALPSNDSEFDHSPTEQVALKITWNILLDTSVSPARMFRFGNQLL